jgi:hypothetical protein
MPRRWLAVLLLLALAGAAAQVVVVKREGVRVMKAPRFFGEACSAAVTPGQRLTVAERKGSWARIAAPGGGQCWVHESAWLDRTPGELAGGSGAASQRDIELAGRGFTEEETSNYRKENPGLSADFALVEAYLARAPETPAPELTRFVVEGALGGNP